MQTKTIQEIYTDFLDTQVQQAEKIRDDLQRHINEHLQHHATETPEQSRAMAQAIARLETLQYVQRIHRYTMGE